MHNLQLCHSEYVPSMNHKGYIALTCNPVASFSELEHAGAHLTVHLRHGRELPLLLQGDLPVEGHTPVTHYIERENEMDITT